MAVPSSGELRLYADIGVELGVAQSNVSLGSMSNSAGFPEPDAMSDFYGYVDAIAPSVVTNSITNIGTGGFRVNGNVTSDGGGTITERGFYVGTNSSSPTNNTKYTVGGTTGAFSRNQSGSSNTTYYSWAYAKNSVGTTYGARVAATTLIPYVQTWIDGGGGMTSYNLNEVYGANVSGRIYYLNPQTGGWVLYRYMDFLSPEWYGEGLSFSSNYTATAAAGSTNRFQLPVNTRVLNTLTMTQVSPGYIVGAPAYNEGSGLILQGIYSSPSMQISNFNLSKTSWAIIMNQNVSSDTVSLCYIMSPPDLVNRGNSMALSLDYYNTAP